MTIAVNFISTCSVVLKLAKNTGSDLYLVVVVVEGAAFVGVVVSLLLRVQSERIVEVLVVRAVD